MDIERKASRDGLTLKLYRGEGAGLLAFDLDPAHATEEFVGFTVEVKHPGARQWSALRNRLNFEYPPGPNRPAAYSSREAPFQKFRWVHMPAHAPAGDFRYRVTARYMRPDFSLTTGATVEAGMSLAASPIDKFVDIGFTRGFASSQAYARRFGGEAGIVPAPNAPEAASLDRDMAPFAERRAWLGFEARRLIVQLLDDVGADPSLSLDAFVHEPTDPDILRRLQALGPRLRAIVDDPENDAGAIETTAAARLEAAGARVKRPRLGRRPRINALVVRRAGRPIQVLTGSAHFSPRGLCIQANNVLLFRSPTVAAKYAEWFDAFWTDAAGFRKNPPSLQWWPLRERADSRFEFCFSPHADAELALAPVAQAIEDARSSVLYAVTSVHQLTGRARAALDELDQRSLFCYGVTRRTGGLGVRKPDGSRGVLPFAWLGSRVPPPFAAEWNDHASNRSRGVHHNFVVTDFNGENPTVFTGSSNLSARGGKASGGDLIRIADRKVATAYAIEALRLFDHLHFLASMRDGDAAGRLIRLARPPNPGEPTWFASCYRSGHVKERDRLLFAR